MIARGLLAAAALDLPALAVAQAPAPPPVISAAPPAPSPAAEAAAEHLMAVLRSDDQYREALPKIIAALLPSLIRGNGGREEEVRRIVSDEFGAAMLGSAPLVHAANRRLLAEHFNERELGDLAGFYTSPLGQKVIREMPAIQLQMLGIGQQLGQAAMRSALPRILDRMKAARMAVPQKV